MYIHFTMQNATLIHFLNIYLNLWERPLVGYEFNNTNLVTNIKVTAKKMQTIALLIVYSLCYLSSLESTCNIRKVLKISTSGN